LRIEDIKRTLRGHFGDILRTFYTSWKSWRKVDFMTKRDAYIQTYQHNAELLRMIQESMETNTLEMLETGKMPKEKSLNDINDMVKDFLPF
jgi:hypothetical protein